MLVAGAEGLEHQLGTALVERQVAELVDHGDGLPRLPHRMCTIIRAPSMSLTFRWVASFSRAPVA